MAENEGINLNDATNGANVIGINACVIGQVWILASEVNSPSLLQGSTE